MPRTRRLIINDETAVYHVMSRTALDGFPLGDVEPQLNPLRSFLRKLNRAGRATENTEIIIFSLVGRNRSEGSLGP